MFVDKQYEKDAVRIGFGQMFWQCVTWPFKYRCDGHLSKQVLRM